MFKNLNTSVLGLAGNQSEVLEQALTHGFRSMDLDIVEFAGRAKVRGIPYARRLLDSAHIQISAFTLPLRLETDPDVFKEDLARLADWASVANELGCTRCLTAVEPAGDRMPYHENYSFHRDRFAAISGVLEPLGIRLGIGFRAAADLRCQKAFQFIHDLGALCMLAKMVNSSNVGIHLDVWDLFVSGASLETLRGIQAGQIVAVDLADAPADVPLDELTESSRLLPEVGGRFDVPAVLVALAEMGYQGPVSIKPHRNAMPSNRADVITKTISQSLDTMWKAAGLNAQGKLPPSVQNANA